MRTALPSAAGLLMLGLFALRADHFARSASQTFDEGAHLVAGVSYWRTGDFRLNPEHPPLLKLLWAVPVALRSDVPFRPDADAWDRRDHWLLADTFLYDGPVRHSELLIAARRVNIALGVGLVALIGWWAYRLWGQTAGLLACALAASDPNLAAFAGLLSMDLGLALFGTAAGYALWEYAGSGGRRWFLLAGVALGLALAAKFSAVVTVAGLGLGAIGYVLAGGTFALPGAVLAASRRQRLAAVPSAFVRLGLVAVAVIVVSYFGVHALDWARGLKQQLVRGDQGDPHFFLDGEITSTGWWRYFPEAVAIKTSSGILLMLLISLVALKGGRRLTRRDVAFLVVPAAVYFLAMTASRIDIGWRVILPAYPALILLAARAITILPNSGVGRMHRWALPVAVVLPPVVAAGPPGHELSYANSLGVGRAQLHRHLGDSNIDWGQGLGYLAAEVRARGNPVIYLSYAGTARPEAYGVRHERLPGWGQLHPPPADRVDPAGRVLVAVSVSNLQGTYLPDPTTYHWLLDREPVSRTDGSIWLWDVTGDGEVIDRLRALAANP